MDILLENVIYCGDNLTWLKQFPDKCIDLIYLDPPFFSNKQYEVIFHDGEEIRAFEDRWKGGINHYIEWMKDRVFELHRVLKDTGSFYLHCDWHAGHYLKVMCDEIFGYMNFRNEIIWFYETGGIPQKDFSRKHDNIFRYTKTDNIIFNSDEIKENRSDEVLRRIATGIPGATRSKGQYRHPSDVWKIPSINAMAKERLHYPTQKPEALLERIIKASSNQGDLVLDPFCGCGTTIAVAQKLQRNWIGIDVSPSACKLMKFRVEKAGAYNVKLIGLPINIEDLKKLPAFEFQNWAIGALGGTINPKKVGDMGIDGFTFMNRDPVQVKQSENIGRNVIDNFETALKRAKNDIGYIIAFSFGKGAYEEVARAKHNGIHIELLTVDRLLEFKEVTERGKIL